MHACLQKEGTVTVDVRYCEKENQPEWYRFYLVSIAEEDGKTDRMVGRFCCVQQEKAITAITFQTNLLRMMISYPIFFNCIISMLCS